MTSAVLKIRVAQMLSINYLIRSKCHTVRHLSLEELTVLIRQKLSQFRHRPSLLSVGLQSTPSLGVALQGAKSGTKKGHAVLPVCKTGTESTTDLIR